MQEATEQHRLGWYLQIRYRPDGPWKDLFFLLEVEFHVPDYAELNYFTSHGPNLFTQVLPFYDLVKDCWRLLFHHLRGLDAFLQYEKR